MFSSSDAKLMGRSLVVTGVVDWLDGLMYDWPDLTIGEKRSKVRDMQAAMQQDEILSTVFKTRVLAHSHQGLPTPTDMELMIIDITKTGLVAHAESYLIRR